MVLSHIYHLFPSKLLVLFECDSFMYLKFYQQFPSKVLLSFEYDCATYLPFISLINYWHHLNMILPQICQLFPLKNIGII